MTPTEIHIDALMQKIDTLKDENISYNEIVNRQIHQLQKERDINKYLESKLTESERKISELKDKLLHYETDAIHTCHNECKRYACVRERKLNLAKISLSGIAKEAEGFINCHEMVISMDGGNSNMAVMRIRIKHALDTLEEIEGKND